MLCWVRWTLAVSAVMASPIVLLVAVPAMVGLVFDVTDTPDERLLVMALSGAVGLFLLRRLARRMPSRIETPQPA